MEEPLEVRYAFMMLLAMCDATGHVIGTDVAIARRMNMPVDEFQQCVAALMEPDPESNSKERDGRRVVNSEHERGYFVVNYLTYRDMKTEESKREYMKKYMQEYREKKRSCKTVKANSKNGKSELASVRHAEAEGEEDANTEGDSNHLSRSASPSGEEVFSEFWTAYPRKKAKADAERAWKNQKCSAILPQILVAIRAAKASHDWTKEFGRFIPYPASWLNSRGWEDEIPKNGHSILNLTASEEESIFNSR